MGIERQTIHYTLTTPTKCDGAALAALIRQCPPLEPNTTYAYLLFCTHFAETCVIARDSDGAVGAIVAYRLPDDPEALFVWQICVHERARGTGLGSQMLHGLLERTQAQGVRYLEATVSPSNVASDRLFTRVAATYGVPCVRSPYFEATDFGAGDHEAELRYRIGPLPAIRKENLSP